VWRVLYGWVGELRWCRAVAAYRRRRLLRLARRLYGDQSAALDLVTDFDESTRQLFRRLLRTFAVQQAAYFGSPWRWSHHWIRLSTAVICLVTARTAAKVISVDSGCKLR
jgi:hypothetical protein